MLLAIFLCHENHFKIVRCIFADACPISLFDQRTGTRTRPATDEAGRSAGPGLRTGAATA